MKRGTLEHPKMLDLQDRLQRPIYQVGGLVEALWHFTARYAAAGDVGRWSNAAIARAIQWEGDADELVHALVESRWLDEHPEHRLLVHDWPEHADDAVQRQLARARQLFADGSMPKLGRLTENERAKLAPELEKLMGAQQDTQRGAHEAHGGRTVGAPPRPVPSRPSPPEEEEPETPAAAGEPPAPSLDRLLNLLGQLEGSKREKELWLEAEGPVIQAEAEAEAEERGISFNKAAKRIVTRYYRSYLARAPTAENQGMREYEYEAEAEPARRHARELNHAH